MDKNLSDNLAETHALSSARIGLEKRDSFGRYKPLAKIGEGGMASVYLVNDPAGRHQLVLKVMHDNSGNNLARLQREAEAMARLSHPHIARVYTMEIIEGFACITMDYIRGDTLDVFIKKHSPNLRQKLEIICQIAETLHYAHRQGVIHRDLKPKNILVDERGKAYVMDFGIARLAQVGENAITKTGAVLGTPRYMSPEQAAGEWRLLDKRTDVFSLGCILYEVLTATPAFTGSSIIEILGKVILEEPRNIAEIAPDTPQKLIDICHRVLQKSPKNRYQTTLKIARELQAFLNEKSPGVTRNKGHNAKYLVIAALLLLLSISSYSIHKFWVKPPDHNERENEVATSSEYLAQVEQDLCVLHGSRKDPKIRQKLFNVRWQRIEVYKSIAQAMLTHEDPDMAKVEEYLAQAARYLRMLQEYSKEPEIRQKLSEVLLLQTTAKIKGLEKAYETGKTPGRKLAQAYLERGTKYRNIAAQALTEERRDYYQKAEWDYAKALQYDAYYEEAHRLVVVFYCDYLQQHLASEQKILSHIDKLPAGYWKYYYRSDVYYHIIASNDYPNKSPQKQRDYYQKLVKSCDKTLRFCTNEEGKGNIDKVNILLRRGKAHFLYAKAGDGRPKYLHKALADSDQALQIAQSIKKPEAKRRAKEDVLFFRAEVFWQLDKASAKEEQRKRYFVASIEACMAILDEKCEKKVMINTYEMRGKIYREMGRWRKAREDFSAMIELDSKQAKGYLLRAEAMRAIYLQKKDMQLLDEIHDDLSTAIELLRETNGASNILVIAYEARADLHILRRDYQKAHEDCTALIRIVPEEMRFYRKRGNLYAIEALREIDKPDLAKIAKARQAYSKAIELLQQGQSVGKEIGAIYRQRALCQAILDDYQQAREDLAKALSCEDMVAQLVVLENKLQIRLLLRQSAEF